MADNSDAPIVSKRSLDDFDFKRHAFESRRFASSRPLAGFISIRVKNVQIASQLLKKYQNEIAFWQAGRQFKIRFPRSKSAVHTTGFSKKKQPSMNSIAEIERALLECEVNAINQFGHNIKYEGRAPSYVKPQFKDAFTLLIYVDQMNAETFFEE